DEILADVVDDQLRRTGVVARHADVERVPVEEDADFGGLAGSLSFVRLGLNEAVGRFGEPPCLFVERAVDDDGRARFLRMNHAAAVGRLKLEGSAGGKKRRRQQQRQQEAYLLQGGTILFMRA